jgi:hypothetical protein
MNRAVTPVDQQVDRVLAVIDALKVTTKTLETIHEIDAWRASMSFDKAPLAGRDPATVTASLWIGQLPGERAPATGRSTAFLGQS